MNTVLHSTSTVNTTTNVLPASRTGSSFVRSIEIQCPWGGIDSVLNWCHQELAAEWRWQVLEMSSDIKPGKYIFYFDSERDCCAFTLKWA